MKSSFPLWLSQSTDHTKLRFDTPRFVPVAGYLHSLVHTMIDGIVELAVAASTDVAINKAAKHHRWVRIFKAAIGLLFFALVVALIYITVKYS